MKRLLVISLAASLGLSVAACGDGGKAVAEAGINTAQVALDATKTEAAQYVPDELRGIENSLSAARDTFAKRNYLQALAEAQRLPPQIAALGAAVAAKRGELTKEWSDLSTGLPDAMDAIQRQIAVLSKSRRLPAGVTTEGLDGARSGADVMSKTWAEATEALKTGNMVDAVAKARSVKAKAVEVMNALGMPLPDSLK